MRFDEVRLVDFDGNDMNYAARVTTDLTLSYALTDHLQFSVGSTNLFKPFPHLLQPHQHRNRRCLGPRADGLERPLLLCQAAGAVLSSE